MENLYKEINNLYNKDGYYEKYGISLLVSILIILVFFVIWAYYKVMSDIKPIKNDWLNQRCNPKVIPFAGLINKPDGMSAFEFTGNNFVGCTQNILEKISGYALMPINYSVSLINGLMMSLLKSMEALRNVLNNVRNSTSDFSKDTLGRTLNIMIPFQQVVMSLKSIVGKAQGAMTGGLFTAMGVYMTIKSALGSIYQTIIIFLIGLAVLVVTLWVLPFTWPAAAAMTAIFIAVAVLMGIFAIFLKNILKMSGGGKIPNKPKRCFDENTKIELNDGTYEKIKNIKPGTILKNNNRVTSIFKLSSADVDMYNYKNVIVSGDHLLKLNNEIKHVKGLVYSDKIEYYNKEFIYCLNTINKNIIINNTEFLDYDELSDDEIRELYDNVSEFIKNTDINNVNYKEKTEWISQYLDGGFKANTKIDLDDGNTKNIKDIDVGDILQNGEIVLGKVIIDGKNVNNLKVIEIDNEKIILGPNIQIFDKDCGIARIIGLKNNYKHKEEYLYNVITDRCQFKINNIVFLDYNSCIDTFLEKETKTLFEKL